MPVMKPISSNDIPQGENWLYEIKYDGFRCVIYWNQGEIKLVSKNNKELTKGFPEIVEALYAVESEMTEVLPITLDGELVILNNDYQGNFSALQKRGRLKNKAAILKAAETRPASFLAFDLWQQGKENMEKVPYIERKIALESLLATIKVPQLRIVKAFENPNKLWEIIFNYKGEGMIAKRKRSIYQLGKGHHDWLKIKNWRTFHGFLTTYDKKNNYFTVGVFNGENISTIGKCKHGLDKDTFSSIAQFFIKNGVEHGEGYELPPAICASLHTLDLYKNELREPEFSTLLPNISATECTQQKLELDMAMLPQKVELTNTEKIFWPSTGYTKGDLLVYIREIAPYMLPFIKSKALTIIRAPDGVSNEHFFQKHLPDYAPDFINSIPYENKKLIVCDSLDSLIWFANHGAVEYHVPFQYITQTHPHEIVFDLDPPDRKRFSLAIKAANIIKPMLDELELTSFVKTSGNKGLQIHIPLPSNKLSYEDTALITQSIAWTVETAYPNLFTTERMKKKRNERLYIDYVQHGKDKTIITPYSPRRTEEATVSTPLFWEEVKEGLEPTCFTVKNMVERVQTLGCPFNDYFKVGENQELDKVLSLIRG
ncbi:DNA ligase D [Virgibacillus halodenitrificans]|uniref:DNA ligase D n=1 Tax=Virgibacillus halodenitrificans TaxID=1482 RepID=UPI002DB901DC|nr:DNA ligase D [Virgibacillus halodenitrificans]MEC2157964.1 DNA ligase D [Virgibacillus halodenitrificans]